MTLFLFFIVLFPRFYYDCLRDIPRLIRNLCSVASIEKNYYDETLKITPAELFVKDSIDTENERAEYFGSGPSSQKGNWDIIRAHQSYHGIPTAGGYMVFYNKRIGEFFRRINAYKVGTWKDVWTFLVDPESPIMNLLSVKYLVSEKELNSPTQWEKIYEDTSNINAYRFVYKNDKALKRFFTVSSAEIFTDKNNLFTSMDNNTSLQTNAFILNSDLDTNAIDFFKKLETLSVQDRISDRDNIQVSSYKSSSISLTTDTPAPRILIISNSWDTGWSCKIDGDNTRIYPFYYALQGILLPPGKHHIELDYLPKTLSGKQGHCCPMLP